MVGYLARFVRKHPIFSTGPRRHFRLVLIKPSHYDDDGYVIQWFRSSMPSNGLAAVYGLDCAARQVLGPDLPIVVDAYNETNTRIRPDRFARDVISAGAGMVGFVGVHSNQFPGAMDLARRFRALGIDVAIGGFHGRVSRRRSPDDVEAIVRQNAARGVPSYFITDDNFARNKDWEPIFDRLIALREQEGVGIKLTIQVDMLCHRIPGFIGGEAGLESLNGTEATRRGARARLRNLVDAR